MPRTTEQYKIDVETCTKGTVYIEAQDEATARLMVEYASLEQAMRNQTLQEAIKEKVSFVPVSVTKLICGIDYVPSPKECPRDCPDCPIQKIQDEINGV